MKEIEEDTHTHQKTPYNHGLEELILLTHPFYLKTKNPMQFLSKLQYFSQKEKNEIFMKSLITLKKDSLRMKNTVGGNKLPDLTQCHKAIVIKIG